MELDKFMFPQVSVKKEEDGENIITFHYSKYGVSGERLTRMDMDRLFPRIRKMCNATFWVCVHVYIKGHDAVTGEELILNNNTMDIPFKNISAYAVQRMFYHIFFSLVEEETLLLAAESVYIDYFKIVMKRTKPNRSHKRKGMSNRLRTKIFDRDNYTCQMCGRTIEDGVKLHVDHKIPVSKGGTNDLDNLQTLCSDCNMGKFNHMDYKVNREGVDGNG